MDETRNTELEFVVGADGNNQRLDVFLSGQLAELSRSRIQALIKKKQVLLHGRECKANVKLSEGAKIRVFLPEPEVCEMAPEDIALDIVFEDESLLVINKHAGICVHPGAGNSSGTIANALLAHCRGQLSGIGGVERPGIVHRLDKDTSGLLVVAKTDAVHSELSRQFAEREVSKEYIALVYEWPKDNEGTIEGAIARHPKLRKKMTLSQEGKPAITRFRVLSKNVHGYALMSFVIGTGRTHQIRVHAKSIGHPVLGDSLYGGQKVCIVNRQKIQRQLLHSYRLAFVHPITGKKMSFTAPVPEDFMPFLSETDMTIINNLSNPS